jgi:hypothetical protein
MGTSGDCLEVAGESRVNGLGGRSGSAAGGVASSVWCGIVSTGWSDMVDVERLREVRRGVTSGLDQARERERWAYVVCLLRAVSRPSEEL